MAAPLSPAAQAVLTRIIRWIRWLVSRCQQCGRLGALHYHQRTMYPNESDNWVTLCPHCKQKNDEYWDERWAEYNHGCL